MIGERTKERSNAVSPAETLISVLQPVDRHRSVAAGGVQNLYHDLRVLVFVVGPRPLLLADHGGDERGELLAGAQVQLLVGADPGPRGDVLDVLRNVGRAVARPRLRPTDDLPDGVLPVL